MVLFLFVSSWVWGEEGVSSWVFILNVFFRKKKKRRNQTTHQKKKKKNGKHFISFSFTWEKGKKNANKLFPARTRALVLPGVLRCAQHFPCTQRFLRRGLPWHCLPREHSESWTIYGDVTDTVVIWWIHEINETRQYKSFALLSKALHLLAVL